MMRIILTIASVAFAARTAAAQGMLSEAKVKAQKATAATNAHIEAEQKPEAQTRPIVKTAVASVTPAPSAATTLAPNKMTRPTAKPVSVDTAGPAPTIMREMYLYGAESRRDPFVSLLTTNELRPTMSDLRLTGIMYDHSSARRSVATLRDLVTNAQYRVTLGSKLGRMTVSAIRLKTVLFTIDEFGTNRQDSLVIGDTTKVRAK
jgi:hypothetical protein